MSTRRFERFVFAAAGCALTLAFVGNVRAADTRINPTSKIFVAESKGESQISTGEKIEKISQRAVYAAEGASIETKPDASNSLVFSNGSALSVASNSRLEVKRFAQEPFTPNRNDLDVEPSISQTLIKLLHGTVGVCTSRLVAGSSMVYQTPHGSVNIRGHKVLIEVDENETRISLIEGDVTVVGDDGNSSQTLQGGQQAILRKTTPDQPSTVTVQPISSEANTKADDQVSLACMARQTVYFEAVDRNDAPQELRAVQTIPAKLPTQFTVSPDRINP